MKRIVRGCLRNLLATALGMALVLAAFAALYVGAKYMQFREASEDPLAFSDEGYIGGILGVQLPKYTAKRGEDTHGGFHGDGAAWYVYDFDAAQAAALKAQIEDAPHWQALPMTNPAKAFLFGGEVDGRRRSAQAKETGFALPQAGYWFVFDEQAQGMARYSDAQFLAPDRASVNVKLAVYDAQHGRLLYYEMDT